MPLLLVFEQDFFGPARMASMSEWLMVACQL